MRRPDRQRLSGARSRRQVRISSIGRGGCRLSPNCPQDCPPRQHLRSTLWVSWLVTSQPSPALRQPGTPTHSACIPALSVCLQADAVLPCSRRPFRLGSRFRPRHWVLLPARNYTEFLGDRSHARGCHHAGSRTMKQIPAIDQAWLEFRKCPPWATISSASLAAMSKVAGISDPSDVAFWRPAPWPRPTPPPAAFRRRQGWKRLETADERFAGRCQCLESNSGYALSWSGDYGIPALLCRNRRNMPGSAPNDANSVRFARRHPVLVWKIRRCRRQLRIGQLKTSRRSERRRAL